MLVKRIGGLTEFIPSPKEKREDLIRDNSLDLIEKLHQRIERLEKELGVPPDKAITFFATLDKLKNEEAKNKKLHESLITNLTGK